jgi:ribosomal protein S27AE
LSRIKDWAGETARYAIRTGKIARQPCEACAAERAQAHHDDYLKPLSVRWLCVRCHRAWHREHGEAANSDAAIPYASARGRGWQQALLEQMFGAVPDGGASEDSVKPGADPRDLTTGGASESRTRV